MQIDFSQMHCGRDEVRERMVEYIDIAAERGYVAIGCCWLINVNPEVARSNHEFFVRDKDGRMAGINTPEELKQILSDWGYL